MCKRLLREVNTCKHDVCNGGRFRALAFCRERNPDLREEALYGRRRCGATQELPRHHRHIRELALVLTPPCRRVVLGLVLDLRQREVLRKLVLLSHLIGLVACASERHTAENIKKWTSEALDRIGLNAKELLQATP